MQIYVYYRGIIDIWGIGYRFVETICNGKCNVAMQRDGDNGRRAVIVLQLLSYLIATSG